MRIYHESIELPPGESLRLLTWEDNVRDVNVITPDGRLHPYRGAGISWHSHAHMELTVMTHGSGTRCVGDNIQHFEAPEVLLIGSHLPHCWIGLHKSSGYAIQFLFSDKHPLRQVPEVGLLQSLFDQATVGIRVGPSAAEEITPMVSAMQEQDGLARLVSLLSVLNVIRESNELNTCLSGSVLALSSRQVTYDGIKNAIDSILSRFHEPLPLEEILKVSGMSKATFSRHFRSHTGKSFTRFLSEIRVDAAARKLISSDQPISDIAFEVGFESLSHFNHTFKKARGISPRQFRHRPKTKE